MQLLSTVSGPMPKAKPSKRNPKDTVTISKVEIHVMGVTCAPTEDCDGWILVRLKDAYEWNERVRVTIERIKPI